MSGRILWQAARPCVMAFFLGLWASLTLVAPVHAHPMGNFAICHYARIVANKDGRLTVRYLLDRAEIPTVTEKTTLHPGDSGVLTPAETSAYLAAQAASLIPNLDIEADGERLPLTLVDSHLTLSPGAGGLQTLKVTFDLQATLPTTQPLTVSYADHNYEERTGWKEIVLVGAGGASITGSPLGADDRSRGLSVYPKDVIPPQDTTAQFRVAFDGSSPATTAPAAQGTHVSSLTNTPRDAFTQAIASKKLTPLVILLGLFIAFIYGGIHALSPGHGKTIVGAYLVGSRGTAWHAVYLGATVTITHTLGVFALGFVTLFAAKYIVPEKTVSHSGSHFRRRDHRLGLESIYSAPDGRHGLRRAHAPVPDGRRRCQPCGQSTLSHAHGGGMMHSHLPPGADGAPVTWVSLLTLGISGGLLPCPSALVVLLSAVALHRVGYGLALVTAFSLGLAGTLTMIGLLFLHAGRLLSRSKLNFFSSPVMRIVPIFSALFVVGAGIFLVYGAVLQGNIHLFQGTPVIAAAGAVEAAGTRRADARRVQRVGRAGPGAGIWAKARDGSRSRHRRLDHRQRAPESGAGGTGGWTLGRRPHDLADAGRHRRSGATHRYPRACRQLA